MRIFSWPSLLSFLRDINLNETEIELDFNRLPKEALPKVVQLIGLKDKDAVKIYEFDHEGIGHTAVKITLSDRPA